jgi:virulence-associated protein VagC
MVYTVRFIVGIEVMAMADEMERRAKLFKNGRSQAVRLPVEFRFEGSEVRVSRVGNGVLLEPVAPATGVADWEGKGGADWGKVRSLTRRMGRRSAAFGGMVDEAVQKFKEEG